MTRQGAKITHIPELDDSRHTRFVVNLGVPLVVEGMFRTFIHHDCVHNHVVGIQNRVIAKTPEAVTGLRGHLRPYGKWIARRLGRPDRATVDEFISHYKGGRALRYRDCQEYLDKVGWRDSFANITAFTKAENTNPIAKVDPHPRVIQFRSGQYCLEIGRYLKPIEPKLYALSGDGKVLPKGRLIGKGLCSSERATILLEKFSSIRDCVVFGVDCSKYDMHINIDQLNAEHDVYRECYPGDEWLDKLCKFQLRSKGSTTSGVRYQAVGSRMSGDMNTALGNCIIMLMIIAWAMEGVTYPWNIFCDGDDTLLLCGSCDKPDMVDRIGRAYRDAGHVLKWESEAKEFSKIRWCQSYPIEYEPGKWKFVREPHKVMSCALSNVKHKDPHVRRRLVNTIGYAECILNLGVPVLQEYAVALLRNSGTNKYLEFNETDALYHRLNRDMKRLGLKSVADIKPRPVSASARATFELAFGITVGQQLVIEHALANWRFELDGSVVEPAEHTRESWLPPLDRQHCQEYSLLM